MRLIHIAERKMIENTKIVYFLLFSYGLG
jgi:hypothetical protein